MTYEAIKSLVVLLGLLVAVAVFGWRAYQLLWIKLRHAQPSGPFKNWGERIKGLIIYVGAQLRLFRFWLPGTAHFFIFWGFMLLSLTILQAIAEGLMAFFDPEFVLPVIGSFGPLAFMQDVFALLVIGGVLYGLYLRVIVDPERYKGSHRSQGVTVLLFIMTIMVSLLVVNGIRINLGNDQLHAWRPISTAIGRLFFGLESGVQRVVGEISYWIHLAIVLLFLTELPEGKHFHIVTSVPAVLLRNLEARGRLPAALEFKGENNAVSMGIRTMEQFRWRQVLDFYTCTECGRCQQVCPAYASGLSLSPKLMMMELRQHLAKSNGDAGKRFVSDVVTDQMLWSCTSCYACDQECPLFIERIPMIVDMRRYLVGEGRIDSELQGALAKLGRYGNSFGQSERMRAKWTQPIQPAVKDARKTAVEYLWFVGDYASYNAAMLGITQKTAQVFLKIGLDFGILYEGERNSGNDVRRVGEEGLFEMLVDKNMAVLGKCQYQTIITTDPHSYNALKNEYPFNGHYSVLHYAELLDRLISSGQLKFSKKLGYRVTYHDPCYLGRYNGIYDAPRRVIESTGCELVEMPRHADRAFCCGAGGGRIWMKEDELKERPSEIRIREAASLHGVTDFIVACPKDVTMFRDAVKTTGNEERLIVKDLIELVHEAL